MKIRIDFKGFYPETGVYEGIIVIFYIKIRRAYLAFIALITNVQKKDLNIAHDSENIFDNLYKLPCWRSALWKIFDNKINKKDWWGRKLVEASYYAFLGIAANIWAYHLPTSLHSHGVCRDTEFEIWTLINVPKRSTKFRQCQTMGEWWGKVLGRPYSFWWESYTNNVIPVLVI